MSEHYGDQGELMSGPTGWQPQYPGAMVYLPIISGIEVLTTTVPFPGTWVITSLMLLGVLYLLCWDWNRVKYVVYPQQ